MGVLDNDWDLNEEVVMGHLQVLDALGREVSSLVKLDGHWGQAVGFEAQETLACLGSVWRKKMLKLKKTDSNLNDGPLRWGNNFMIFRCEHTQMAQWGKFSKVVQ